MCIESAISIVKVLVIYANIYGFRKANVQMVSFTFSAALILIFTTVPAQFKGPNKEHTKYLGICFWALDEMGGCFENAKRTSTFLSTLQQQWHKRRHTVTEQDSKRVSETQEQCHDDQPFSGNERNTQACSEYYQRRLSRQVSASIDMDLPAGYWTQDNISASEETLDMGDFMNLDLCNILLSEGIPRSLV
ncbi:hypothetical protein N7532_002774 [Penicillium argentinense]|uniref:Uncharacterized protein n=1 Tax=Penicillium argentinense TaxID=1131581 RepID=A0A9W9KKJ0_9EURO|nr:uncharacterized protein N7532_002774 [Penicillium argentinense]KAJ5110129.1 hypothetical protein N7532_002774 [Penicillium argentinense]